tara:strand:- start:198065 stop:198343 length:279 start_codon:yes stop_codon:yes gene_type:complete
MSKTTEQSSYHEDGKQQTAGDVRQTASRVAHKAMDQVSHKAMDVGQDAAHRYVQEPARDLFGLAKAYAKDKPDIAACWAFGLGILVGWKLRR